MPHASSEPAACWPCVGFRTGCASAASVPEGNSFLAVTDPLGHTTRFTYDARGNLRTCTDPLGLTTAFSHDEDDRVVSATRPDGSELRTVRSPFGLPVEVVGPDGARMVHEIVVAEGGGAGAGNIITAYGPSGIRGDSGVTALGGLPTDPGGPIAHADVVEGRIPAKNGYMAPAVQIR